MTLPFPRVAIIVVNWNGTDDTLRCLRSISALAPPAAHVIVLDNGSRQDNTEEIRANYPWADVVRLPTNIGYTGGYNFGLHRAVTQGSEYVLCLNNDTIIEPPLLAQLVSCASADRRVGIVGPVLYARDAPQTIVGAGCFIDFGDHLCGRACTTLESLNGACGLAEYVEGCALLLNRGVIEDTGGFDDTFFAYLEDADLCYRAKKSGWKCVIARYAKVLHARDRSETGALSPLSFFYSARNSWLVARRYAADDEWNKFIRAQFVAVTRAFRSAASLSTHSREQRAHAIDGLAAQLTGSLHGLLRFKGKMDSSVAAKAVSIASGSVFRALLRAATLAGRIKAASR